MKTTQNHRTTNLYWILSAVFLTNALLAEMIGVKIFSLEKLIHADPAQLQITSNFTLDFNLTAGVLIWPVVFITSDLINEYFGKPGIQRVSYLAAACISYAFFAIYGTTCLPPADFWLSVHATDDVGNPFNIDFAFKKIFSQGLGIIIGSLTAFLVGQLLDAYVFHWFKSITGSRLIWLRATGSTLISQLIDSFLVLAIAFYMFGDWSLEMVFAVGVVNYLYKFTVAVLLTPVLYIAHHWIDLYLGKNEADQLIEKADKTY